MAFSKEEVLEFYDLILKKLKEEIKDAVETVYELGLGIPYFDKVYYLEKIYFVPKDDVVVWDASDNVKFDETETKYVFVVEPKEKGWVWYEKTTGAVKFVWFGKEMCIEFYIAKERKGDEQ